MNSLGKKCLILVRVVSYRVASSLQAAGGGGALAESREDHPAFQQYYYMTWKWGRHSVFWAKL